MSAIALIQFLRGLPRERKINDVQMPITCFSLAPRAKYSFLLARDLVSPTPEPQIELTESEPLSILGTARIHSVWIVALCIVHNPFIVKIREFNPGRRR